MSVKHISGCGRLLPTRATGLEYEVHYGIVLLVDTPRRGRELQLSRWGKCSLRSAHAQRIPDGPDRPPRTVGGGSSAVRPAISELLRAEKFRLALARERADQRGMHGDSWLWDRPGSGHEWVTHGSCTSAPRVPGHPRLDA